MFPGNRKDLKSNFVGFPWRQQYTRSVQKKDRTFAVKILLLILEHFMYRVLQSSTLYRRYAVPNMSSFVGMLPGTHFLWWRTVLLSHFPESRLWFGNDVVSKWFSVWETRKSLLGLSPENRVDGAQRIFYVLPNNCRWEWTLEPAIASR